jgi:hypothetical protein
MELVVFCSLSLLGGLILGFIFGCSHDGLFLGLFKGIFIGALFALDLYLLGSSLTYCWCLLGASVCGSIVATYTPDESPVKQYFDLRRPIDF